MLSSRLLAPPLLLCAFRPFFLFSLLCALLALLPWLAFLAGWGWLPAVPGGALIWHAHELLFGFAMAAVAGFVLTAVPEFTRSAPVPRRLFVALGLLWLLGRLCFWAGGWLGVWPSALSNAGFGLLLLGLLTRRLLGDAPRRQWPFFFGLLAMALLGVGFYSDLLRGLYPMRWLYAAIGALMALVVVAMSRISMRIVNDALEALPLAEDGERRVYRSLPPRRNLALFCIALYSLVEFYLPHSAVSGWLALATAASLCNLLNDWHVGRALFTRWALLLYTVYWLMALGYLLLGLHGLGIALPASSGRHLLTIGGIGLSILAVLCIAGRTHSGHALDERPWVPLAAGLLVLSALLRALAGWPGMPLAALQLLSGLAWLAAFGLALAYLGPVFLGPRPDAGQGCEEPLDARGEEPPARCG